MSPTHELELDTPFMRARIEDGVGWMTFNNPDRLNALKMEMNEAFASGADISEFEERRATPDGRARFDDVFGQAGQAFASLRKPLIAMIQGYCIGGGLATALNADLRISADTGQFGIPAVRLGLGYAFDGLKRLTHIVGPTSAAEIMLTGRRFTASEAYDMGLINRVVPEDELVATVTELAAMIASNAPLTVQAAKAAIRETFRDPANQDHDRMASLVEACFMSDDYKEGRQAFMAKRAPNFVGR
jgi:enoyl-CoA hydratase/carnithine racemase